MTKDKYEKGEKKSDSKRETWESLKALGNEHFQHRKYDQGKFLKKLNHDFLVNFWFKYQEIRKAQKAYSKAIQKAPTNGVLYTNRALCKIKVKKFDDACADAREAIHHCPNRLIKFSKKKF